MIRVRESVRRTRRRWDRFWNQLAARVRGDKGHLTPPMRATGPWAQEDRIDFRGGRARRAGKGRGTDGSPARPPGGIVLTCAAAVAALAALSTYGARWLRIAEVQVVGAHVADATQLHAALATAFGAPLWAVEVDALRARLLADPWIDGVKVARRFPRRLRVTVKEARPVFGLADGNGAVSSDGELLPWRPGMEFDDLPQLSAPRAADGSALSQDASEAVRRLCAVLDRSPWTWSEGLCRVELGSDLAVELETSGGARVVLGRDEWGKRLRSLALASEVVRPGPGDRVDLRFDRQIVLHPAIPPQERGDGKS